MSEQKVFILTGLPYAGKSTLSQELAGRFGHKIASVDEELEKESFDVEKMTQEDWDLVYTRAYQNLEQHLQNGDSVIVDIGNLVRQERETARGIAQKVGVPSILIYVKTPLDEIRKRWTENQQTQQRPHLEWVSLERAFTMFEEPTADENPVIYTHQSDINQWIDEHLK